MTAPNSRDGCLNVTQSLLLTNTLERGLKNVLAFMKKKSTFIVHTRKT